MGGCVGTAGDALVNAVLEHMWPLATFDNAMGMQASTTPGSSSSNNGDDDGPDMERYKIFLQKRTNGAVKVKIRSRVSRLYLFLNFDDLSANVCQ